MKQAGKWKPAWIYAPPLKAAIFLSAVLLLFIGGQRAIANHNALTPKQVSPLHPTFSLLDEGGGNVLDSGEAVSTLQTCGACHDTDFISKHSYHTDVGLDQFTAPGEIPDGRAWDTSPGYFGKWNPMSYRYLSPKGDERLDLGTAEWIQIFGARHVGGGPGFYNREGELLDEQRYTVGDPETNIVDPDTGEAIPWDWESSGMVEMNCFLCHWPGSNNEARLSALKSGDFRWASTATLVGSGIVDTVGGDFQWNSAAFDEQGELIQDYVQIQDPSNDNCGQCHGLVHDDVDIPLVITSCAPDRWRTETTGQIVSPQRISDTGMNVANKEHLNRSWDIHAERLVQCTDCHYSLNNPIYFQESDASRPEHLNFDPRRLSFGEYLYQPSHQFARGQSAQSSAAPEFKDTMRRCESCHSITATHEWLPYKSRHMDAISCESCHIPRIYAFAREKYDWTVVRPSGDPLMACRGIDSEKPSLELLATGFDPALLPRVEVDGNTRLAPHNLVTSWFWIYGNPPRPVRLLDLKAAWLDGEEYHAEVIKAFDQNNDGMLKDNELIIDSPEKVEFIAGRLKGLGLQNPRISGEIQPYSINHSVATGEWATKDCNTCHSEDSRLTKPVELSPYVPGDVLPAFISDSNVSAKGRIFQAEDGALYYQPSLEEHGLYILGHDSIPWVDKMGLLILAGTFLAVLVHGGFRVWSVKRRGKHALPTQTLYMYSIYERLWHWLQTFVIVGLLFTGLIIHKPALFGALNFRHLVLVHNILAAILVINAFLALFYHLASGEIRQYIPRPYGFFDQAIVQAKFYLRGIFTGEMHPFDKTPQKKLNPLQQITYFGLLNVLLPLQVITGILIWGAQRWPDISGRLGGLTFLSPFHTLITWLLAAFIVAHVYLTTTGHAPTAAIKAMMMGWDEVELLIPTEEDLESDHSKRIQAT